MKPHNELAVEAPANTLSATEMHPSPVAILLPSLLIGGAEKSLIELSNGLAQRGWNIHLVVMSTEGPLIGQIDPKVRLVDLGCSSYRDTVRALARYYKQDRPAAILTSMYATGLAAIAAKIISAHKPRVVVGGHSSIVEAHRGNPKDRLLLHPLCKVMFPLADGIIAVSRGLALELERFIRIPRHRIRTIYNPVVTANLATLAKEQLFHPWLDGSRKAVSPTLVSVGRLVEHKGYDVLLHALVEVRRHIDCRLIIVGGGPLELELKALAQRLELADWVDFVGWQDNPFKYVARADLFVLSSRYEGLANVVIEALACGCPVVATDCNYGPDEILESGKYGGLAATENPDDLASKILVELGKERDAGGRRAARKSRSLDFTVAAAVEQYSRVLTEICGAGPRGDLHGAASLAIGCGRLE